MIVSVLRKEARENLKGKWKKALLFMLVFYLLTIAIDFGKAWIAVNTPYRTFARVLGLVINVVLNYGILASFIKIKRNEKVNCLHFIYYSGRDAEKVWRNIGRLIWKVLFYFLTLLLFLYLTIQEIISLCNGNGVRLSFFIEILVTLVLSIALSMKILYYSLMNYVLYDNREWKAKKILKESERLMKNHRWDFTRMYLSFAGWFILGLAFCAGLIALMYFVLKIQTLYLLYIIYIPLIFLLPYVYTTTICFYDNLVYNNPRPKEEETNTKQSKKNKRKSNKKK